MSNKVFIANILSFFEHALYTDVYYKISVISCVAVAYYTIPDSKGKHRLFLAMLLSSHQLQAITLRTKPAVVGTCGTLY